MWIWLGLSYKRNTFYSKGNNYNKGFYIKFEGVALFYVMDRSIKDKKVVCGVYNKNELGIVY
jgi:hypothetical protein